MKKVAIILICFFCVCCAETSVEPSQDSFVYFEQHLKAEMEYGSLINTFGEPDSDIGSGIHIYVYKLQDNTKIHIGFVDKVLYARHVDVNDQLIKVMI